eukprot:scaffold1164_cov191-Alexandrium_tamarense.AAC.10
MDIQSRSTSKESSYCGFDPFDDRGSFSSQSRERISTNKHFSRLLKEESSRFNKTSESGSVLFFDHNEGTHDREPKNTAANLRLKTRMLECQMKKSFDSEDSSAPYIHISSNYTESRDDDAVSTLSRNSGVTTIGSASFCTTDTDKINAHVQKLVSSIVKTELNTAGTMRCALEEALRSKAKLEAKIKKLEKKSGEQMLQLREARRTQQIAVEEYENELEVHLTRKAAQLKECVELALAQAEASKRREVELARGKMEMEIALLRSQLDDALENGVVVDGSLRNALDLVESNQQALREAAANNARSTLSMKNEIEHSFISAVTEFEVPSPDDRAADANHFDAATNCPTKDDEGENDTAANGYELCCGTEEMRELFKGGKLVGASGFPILVSEVADVAESLRYCSLKCPPPPNNNQTKTTEKDSIIIHTSIHTIIQDETLSSNSPRYRLHCIIVCVRGIYEPNG